MSALAARDVLAERLWHLLPDGANVRPRDIQKILEARDQQWAQTLVDRANAGVSYDVKRVLREMARLAGCAIDEPKEAPESAVRIADRLAAEERLVRYRCAALTALLNRAGSGSLDDDQHPRAIGAIVEWYAHAMLAAERAPK